MKYTVGQDFGFGQREHAIPDGAEMGSPANTAYFGYKVSYHALCKRKVWEYTTRSSAPPSQWEPGPLSCRACVRAYEKITKKEREELAGG